MNKPQDLIYTSVDDMKTSLHFYGVDDLPILRLALEMSEQNGGNLTRSKILRSKIKRLEKTAQAQPINS